MTKEPPFDVWDGEELGLTGETELGAAEEAAMHLEPESEVETGMRWSDPAEDDDGDERMQAGPAARYFADEQPDVPDMIVGWRIRPWDERALDLDELLVRQHYIFPEIPD